MTGAYTAPFEYSRWYLNASLVAVDWASTVPSEVRIAPRCVPYVWYMARALRESALRESACIAVQTVEDRPRMTNSTITAVKS